MKKIAFVLPAAFLLASCTLQPTAPITGTNTQKAEKLSQIINNGGQADCKVTNLADSTTTQIIVSGKKMKMVGSNFGQGKQGTMINDTAYTYIWSEDGKTGIKTKVETPTPTPVVSASPSVTPVAVNTEDKALGYEDETKYKVDCTQRVVTDSEFVPPADVKFTDYSSMMKGVPTAPKVSVTPKVTPVDYGDE